MLTGWKLIVRTNGVGSGFTTLTVRQISLMVKTNFPLPAETTIGLMQVVAEGIGKTLDLDHDFSGVRTTVDPVKGRRRQRLRKNTYCRSGDKSTGIECRQIIVRRGLDVIPRSVYCLIIRFALFVFRDDGFLTAIIRVRNQNRQRVGTRPEGRYIDGWSRERRITVHPVVRVR